MPKPPIPGGVMTIGVMNIVLGSLCTLCSLGTLIMQGAGPIGGDPALERQMQAFMERELPSSQFMQWLMPIFALLCHVNLLISGTAMINRANWGRILSIVTAAMLILHQGINSVYTLAFVAPVQTRFFRQQVFFPGPDPSGILTMVYVVAIGIALLLVTYAVVSMCILVTARTREFFARTSGGFADDYRDDYRDSYRDDYRNENRDEWPPRDDDIRRREW